MAGVHFLVSGHWSDFVQNHFIVFLWRQYIAVPSTIRDVFSWQMVCVIPFFSPRNILRVHSFNFSENFLFFSKQVPIHTVCRCLLLAAVYGISINWSNYIYSFLYPVYKIFNIRSICLTFIYIFFLLGLGTIYTIFPFRFPPPSPLILSPGRVMCRNYEVTVAGGAIDKWIGKSHTSLQF